MRKNCMFFITTCFLVASLVVPAFGANERSVGEYDQEPMVLSEEEIQLKKDTVSVPEELNDKVSTYVQSKEDIWSVLSRNLDPTAYGGLYVEDGVLHINVVDESKVQAFIGDFSSYTSGKLRSRVDDIVLEYDAVYTWEQLDHAVERLVNGNVGNKLDIYGIGIDDKINGLVVDAYEWTQEKKDKVADILDIDMDHINWGIVERVSEEQKSSSRVRPHPDDNLATPGCQIGTLDTGTKSSLGIGVYYEIQDITEGNGEYGWITSAHYYEEGDRIYKLNNYDYYMGFIDFLNLDNLPGRDFAWADVAVIYKSNNSEVDYSLQTFDEHIVANGGDAVQGERVYMSGATSGLLSGKVLSANYTVPDWDGQGASKYRYMVKTNIESANGDSGAPLLRESGTNRYTILGILKGREKEDNYAFFTSWETIEYDLYYLDRDGRLWVRVWLWP